jgi:hypothetical protein
MRFGMFGNGALPPQNGDPQEPASSSSMWGDMFGVGSLFKVITDPQLGQHAAAMMQAISAGAQASTRIERKLNMLLAALGHEIDENGNVRNRPGGGTPLLAADGPHGNRGFAATGGAPDDGGRGLAGDGRLARDADRADDEATRLAGAAVRDET